MLLVYHDIWSVFCERKQLWNFCMAMVTENLDTMRLIQSPSWPKYIGGLNVL